MEKVRLGIVGKGGIGSLHYRNIMDGKTPRIELTAVCDIDSEKLASLGDVKTYEDSHKLIRSGDVDAVLICTPHYAHTTIGIDALEQGLHVLVEKPISVHKADAERLVAAHKSKKQVFAAMFNQRTDPRFRRVKKLIDAGELGEIQRTNWIITDWFRPEAYYASGGWRATWAGEGGGVLLNQCPHNLDLFQWICGMPSRVHAFCNLGKYHKIEVEDEVTAYLQYSNGATGMFITTTGEAPGTNRLEIAGDRGKIVVEGPSVRFTRNETPAREFSRTTNTMFGVPDVWNVEIPIRGTGEQHVGIVNNFAAAILDREPLIAPAEEGLRSVELANAMLLSSMTGKTVDLPLDGKGYERRLKKLISESGFVNKSVRKVKSDISKSF